MTHLLLDEISCNNFNPITKIDKYLYTRFLKENKAHEEQGIQGITIITINYYMSG